MRAREPRAAAAAVVAVVAFAVAVVAAVPLLAGSGGAASAATAPQTWLDRVNEVRVSSGVAAVTENASWTLGIAHHLTYLEQTPLSYRTGQYASDHTENPAAPLYTADGALEASRSNLMHGKITSDVQPIDAWFGAPFHAIGMLRPGLRQVAFARDTSYAGLDVISGKSSVTVTSPTLFPGPGSSTYLTKFGGGESPDPIETCRSTKSGADYSAPGLPIIAMLTQAPTTNLVATLTTPGGTAVSSKDADVCVVDANTYVSTDQVYGATGKQILTNDNAVLIIPRTRLVTGTYGVQIAQSKQADITWSFTVDPTLAPSTAPTSTAPTSTATTSTTATSTATSTATTTATSTATAVAPLAPVVAAVPISCSVTNGSSGAADLSIANPMDGGGAATYTIGIAGSTFQSDPAQDGAQAMVPLSHLPAGTSTSTVTGSDGTSATYPVSVPGCPAWTAARVRFGNVSRRHRQRVTLDNTRNAGGHRFLLRVGTRELRAYAAGGGSTVVVVRLSASHATRVRVYLGTHLLAGERVRP